MIPFVRGNTIPQLIIEEKITSGKQLDSCYESVKSKLETLHQKGVAHGDFHIENFLCVPGPPTSTTIIDFGQSTLFDPKNVNALRQDVHDLDFLKREISMLKGKLDGVPLVNFYATHKLGNSRGVFVNPYATNVGMNSGQSSAMGMKNNSPPGTPRVTFPRVFKRALKKNVPRKNNYVEH